jgi:hypothetical protein
MTTQHFAVVAKELKMKESKKTKKPFPPRETKSTLATRHLDIARPPLGRNHWFPSPFSESGARASTASERARRHGRARLAQVNGRARVSAGERKR